MRFIKRALPHVCIMCSIVIVVLWILDRYNPALKFLGVDLFKIPLLIFCVLVILTSVLLIIEHWRQDS